MDDASALVNAPLPARYHSVRRQQNNAAPALSEASPNTIQVHRNRSRYHQKSQSVASEPAPPRPRHSNDVPGSGHLTSGNMSSSRVSQRELDTDHHEVDVVTKTQYNKPDVRFDQAPQIIHASREGDKGPKDEIIPDHDDRTGCFGGLFRRKKVDPIKNMPEKSASPQRATRPTSKEQPKIRSGGRGQVSGNDAPLSAVNAGERRVLVECNASSLFLPVTPETTALDLISSSAKVFSHTIDMHDSVLLECFASVGLQRPLRRYERIREVMNSWEEDTANSLLIVPSKLANVRQIALRVSGVPQAQPVDVSFLMNHSHKPGSWDKRLITIRQDGQLVMAKEGKNKTPATICHLSDFDIYTPTAQQLSKKIKPPGSYCYAIKSQQKASMFVSTSTFVHFFCHGDQAHGQAFHDAVHTWRSWFLVNIMGEGKEQSSSSSDFMHSTSKRAANLSQTRRNTSNSMRSNHQLDSSQPVTIGMSQVNRTASSRSHDAVPPQQRQPPMSQIPSRALSSRDRANLPSSLPIKDLPLADNEPLIKLAANRRASFDLSNRDQVPFAEGGLLGRTYSKHRTGGQGGSEHPTLDGNGVIGIARQVSIRRAGSKRIQNAGPHRPSTCEGHVELGRAGSIDIHRSASRKTSATKPLVDLTPQYQPPPQHMRKGRAYKPSTEELRGGVLIDAATNREHSWRADIPENKEWRASGAAIDNEAYQRKHSSAPHSGQNPATAGAIDPSTIIPSRSFRGVRSNGFRNEENAQAPLIDLSKSSSFTNGSLLNRLEKENPKPGPMSA